MNKQAERGLKTVELKLEFLKIGDRISIDIAKTASVFIFYRATEDPDIVYYELLIVPKAKALIKKIRAENIAGAIYGDLSFKSFTVDDEADVLGIIKEYVLYEFEGNEDAC